MAKQEPIYKAKFSKRHDAMAFKAQKSREGYRTWISQTPSGREWIVEYSKK